MENTILTNSSFILVTMGLASLRIYLELIGFDFNSLPITKKMGHARSRNVHRMGLIFSIGYIVLFAPQVLLGSIVLN